MSELFKIVKPSIDKLFAASNARNKDIVDVTLCHKCNPMVHVDATHICDPLHVDATQWFMLMQPIYAIPDKLVSF